MCGLMCGKRGMGVAVVVAIAAAIGAAVLIPNFADAQPQSGERSPRGEGRGRGGEGSGGAESVDRLMKGMNRALRSLRESIADASKKDENIKRVNEMQRACVLSKLAGVPEQTLAHAKTDAEKQQRAADYRAALIAAIRGLLDVEEHLVAGKFDEATKSLDAFVKTRDAAHKKMGVD